MERLPFDGTWQIVEGGATERQNAHHGAGPQTLAMDIVKVDERGRRRNETGELADIESYLSWGQPLYSPIAGTVEIATDGIPDNRPGEKSVAMVYGNSVMIRSAAGWLVVLAHFKNGSLTKKRGDRVEVGELLGRCGNSGHSREPHLHFQVQSEAGYDRGVALRLLFRAVSIKNQIRRDYSPVQRDIVSDPPRPDRD